MSESSDEIDRLADAIDAFLARDPDDDGSKADSVLEQRPELREFLEPMLAGQGGGGDQDEPADAAGAPARVGPYLIRGELGRGGMGIVYEAEHEHLGRPAAVKVLPELMSLSPRRIRRFLREAKAAARLDHPGLARIHEVGEVRGTWWFAMDLVVGETLGARLRAASELHVVEPGSGRLWIAGCDSRYDDAAEVGIQLADALAHVHEHGLVHRDVKPQNVLVDAGGRVRLVDFGLAKDLEDHSLTGSGDFMGTPNYSAPEQVERRVGQRIDGRADLFALGCVLYELVALRRPFEGRSTESIIKAVLSEEPRTLASIDPGVPTDLQTVVSRLLEKDPAHRYQTAADVRDDLRRLRAGMPIVARPRGAVQRAVRWVRRHPAWSVAWLLAFALFVVTPITAAIVLEQKGEQLQRERDAARRNFAAANRAVDQLFTRVAESSLVGDARLQAFRRVLLEDARRFYVEFLEDAGQDEVSGLRREVALATERIAVVDYELARFAQAIEGFDAAIRRLHAFDDPERDRLDLADCYASRGLSREVLGDLEAAQRDYDVAERLWAQATLPADRDRAEERLARLRIGRVNRMRGDDPDRAMELLDLALAAIDALEARGYESLMLSLDRCQAEIFRASILLRRGDRDAAAAALARADEVRREQADVPRTRGQRSISALIRAELAHAAGRFDEAEQLYRTAIDDLRRRAAIETGNVGLRADLARACDRFARFLVSIERYDDGLQVARTALDDAEWLHQNASTGRHGTRLLGAILSTAATAATFGTFDDVERIDAWFDRALELERELLAFEPENAVYMSSLGGTLNNRAMRLLRRPPQDRERAIELLSEAVEHQRRAVAAQPDERTFEAYLFNHLSVLAPNLLLAGRAERGAELLLEARGMCGGSVTRSLQTAGALSAASERVADAALAARCREAMFELLAVAAAGRPEAMHALRDDPRFTPFVHDARFVELTR